MTDKEPALSPEGFISSLDDEQLEAVRLDYFGRLAAASDQAAAILGPTCVAECHQAIGAEMLIRAYGRDFYLKHLDSFHAQIEKMDDFRPERTQ